MSSEGLALAGIYFHFGDEPAALEGMRAVYIYRTPGDTLIVRSCDDPDGRMSMILSHLNNRELSVMMECIGTDCLVRKTA